MATYTRGLWQAQEGPLAPLHRAWVRNLLFLAGRQWFEFQPHALAWTPPNLPHWRKQPVTNLCLPYYQHYVAKLTKQRPVTTAMPASTDVEDIYAARLADDVLEAKWLELRLSKLLRQAIAWLAPTGNAFLLPYWDSEAGELEPSMVEVEAARIDEETGEEVGVEQLWVPADEEGNPLMAELPDGGSMYDVNGRPHMIDLGDVGVKSVSPFHVRVDPSAETDEEIRWFIVADPRPVEEVEELYPDLRGRISADSDIGMLERFDTLIHGLALGGDAEILASSIDRDREEAKAVVYHYHEKPSTRFPEGRYWQVVGDQTPVDPQELPEGIWPCMVHLKDYEVPGQYHGGSRMSSIVNLNKEYNEVTGSILEHHNLMLRGKWLVPRGSGIRKGQITTMPGEVIQHAPGLGPKQAELRPLPAPVYQERDRIKADFQLVSGINKVTMGQPPQGVSAGRAFLVLQEADDSDFGPLTEMLEEGVADLGWMLLRIIQSRYHEERLVRVVGGNRRYKVRRFKGADLEGVLDVKPQTGSAFPWSQVARQDLLLQMLRENPDLFVDEETGQMDKHRISRLLPIAGLESMYQGEDLDVNEALREEDLFEEWDGASPLPEIQPWQNHGQHYRSHTRVLKGTDFAMWPEDRKQAFLEHWHDTRAAVEAEEMRKALLAQGLDPAQEFEAAMAEGEQGGGGIEGSQPAPGVSEEIAAREHDIRSQESELDQVADAIERGRVT